MRAEGFSVLRVASLQGDAVTHKLLVRRNVAAQKVDRHLDERTLFVTHLGCLGIEDQSSQSRVQQALQVIFGQFGLVEAVDVKVTLTKPAKLKAHERLDQLAPATAFARVVFEKAQAARDALAFADQGQVLDAPDASRAVARAAALPWRSIVDAFEKSISGDAYVDCDALQDEVDLFMTSFDAREAEEKRKAKEGPVVDDDGFTLVTAQGGTAADGTHVKGFKTSVKVDTGLYGQEFKREEAVASTPAADKKQLKKQREEERMPEFYRFQFKEKQRAKLAASREEKKKDEKVVERMVKRKKFDHV